MNKSVEYVLERLKRMTPEEFIASLIRAGIITKDKKLTAKYRQK